MFFDIKLLKNTDNFPPVFSRVREHVAEDLSYDRDDNKERMSNYEFDNRAPITIQKYP